MTESVVPTVLPERLGPLDAAFLYGETPEHPLHVGALCVFDAAGLTDAVGRLRYDDVCSLFAARIHRIPRLRQRVLAVPFGAGRPVWADDSGFDVRRHLRRAGLPSPGSWDQLLDLVGDLQARPLERGRPLWEFWFVEGLAGGRIAVVPKIHHSLGDGVSLVDLALLLLDPAPETATTTGGPIAWTPTPAPSGAQRVMQAAADAANDAASAMRGVVQGIRDPMGTVGEGAALVRTLRSSLRLGSPFRGGMGLKGRVGPHRQVRTASVPLDLVRQVRKAHAVTVNDVVLCAVVDGVRELVGTAHLPDHSPRAIVPVSMRGADERGGGLLGNRVSLVLPELPVGVSDPVERLGLVNAEMSARKAESEARHTGALLDAARFLPPVGLRAVARGLMRTQPFASLLVTNVPGPTFPLYMCGARLLELYPYLGSIGGMGIVVAVASYDGNLAVTVTADPDLTGDATAFAEGMEKGFHALCASV